MKLKVQFTSVSDSALEDKGKAGGVSGNVSWSRGVSVSEHTENIRNKLSREGDGNSSSIGDAAQELVALRSKYDAVVEYTVQLTAERDTIVLQLEDLQREYAKELSQKVDGGSKGGAAKNEAPIEKKIQVLSLEGFCCI